MDDDEDDTLSELEPRAASTDIESIRRTVVECIAFIYRSLGEERQKLTADEYSRRRRFLDELTIDVSRISFLPDDEVLAAYEDFGLGLSPELAHWFIDHIVPRLENSDIKENEQFSFVLDWEFVTLVTLRNYLIYC
jgi:hypothetical protein